MYFRYGTPILAFKFDSDRPDHKFGNPMKKFHFIASIASLALFAGTPAFAGDSNGARNADVRRAPEAPKETLTAVFNGQSCVTAKIYGKFDQAPTVKYEAVARYPEGLAKAGVKGKAIVTFNLDYRGKATNYSVVATHQEFAAAAIAAAIASHYGPAKDDGLITDCKLELIYDFPGPRVSD